MKKTIVIFSILVCSLLVSGQAKKVSQMPVATSVTGTELIPIVQSGVNKSVTPTILLSSVGAGYQPNEVLNASIGVITTVGADDIEIYVYDVNTNGYLDELNAAIVLARSYTSCLIRVCPGVFYISNGLSFTIANRWTEVRGDNTWLYMPGSYTGAYIDITLVTGNDFYRFRISGLTFIAQATYDTADGIRITAATGSDMQMCYFNNIGFVGVNNVINVIQSGSAWVNGNVFTNILCCDFVRFLKTATGAFDGNTFNSTNLQTTGSTVVGVDNLSGKWNTFYDFKFWDSNSGVNAIVFGSGAEGNKVLASEFDNALCVDNSTSKSNLMGGSFFTTGNGTPRQNWIQLTEYLYLLPTDNPPTAVEGRVYADTDHNLYYYNGSSWVKLNP